MGIRQSCKIYSTGKLPPVAHARKGSELIRGGGKTAMVCSSPASTQPTRVAQEVPHGCVLAGQEGTRGVARQRGGGAISDTYNGDGKVYSALRAAAYVSWEILSFVFTDADW